MFPSRWRIKPPDSPSLSTAWCWRGRRWLPGHRGTLGCATWARGQEHCGTDTWRTAWGWLGTPWAKSLPPPTATAGRRNTTCRLYANLCSRVTATLKFFDSGNWKTLSSDRTPPSGGGLLKLDNMEKLQGWTTWISNCAKKNKYNSNRFSFF